MLLDTSVAAKLSAGPSLASPLVLSACLPALQHQLCRSLGLLPPTSTVASSSAPSPDVRLLAATWDPASSCLNVDLSLARARLVVIDGSGACYLGQLAGA